MGTQKQAEGRAWNLPDPKSRPQPPGSSFPFIQPAAPMPSSGQLPDAMVTGAWATPPRADVRLH